MKIKIPYSFLPPKALAKASRYFLGIGEELEVIFPFLKLHLRQSGMPLDAKEYLSRCFVSTALFFLFMFAFVSLVFAKIGFKKYLLVSFGIAAIFSIFIFMQQIMYPRLIVAKRVREIERNLIPVLQNIMVQLNSGVPLFDIIVNIASGEYGAISEEFLRAVKEINAGRPQVAVLEEIAAKNPSLYFRRSLWQIVNGMKSGADMSNVLSQVLHALGEEQVIQIQKYGSQLNPLAMFYMLVAIIAPSLGITFIIVVSSFVSPSETGTKMVFWGLYGFAVFFQVMFLGIIKSRRPNLLST